MVVTIQIAVEWASVSVGIGLDGLGLRSADGGSGSERAERRTKRWSDGWSWC